MQKNNDHIKKWGVADFERYHSGEMTADQRHALEKAALDDPFLQDALDGFVFAKSPFTDVEKLRVRIAAEGQKRKMLAIWMAKSSPTQILKIAAVLVLVAGFSWLIFNHNKDKQKELAQLPISQKGTPVDHNKLTSDSATSQLEKSASYPNQGDINKRLKIKELTETTSQKNKAIDDPITDERLLAKLEEDQVRYPELSFKDKGSVSDLNKKKTAPMNGDVVLSKDKDNDNASEAAISNKKEQGDLSVASNFPYMSEKAIPNANNNQSLTKAPFFSNNNVNGNAAVVESSNMGNSRIENNQNMADVEGEKSLKEVVVVGYSQQAKSKRMAESTQKISSSLILTIKSHATLINASPLKDSALFFQALEQRLKNSPFNAIKGELILYFELDNEGFAKKIAVKKSLGDSCDAEAKRILQSSPAMIKVKKGKRAEVIFRF